MFLKSAFLLLAAASLPPASAQVYSTTEPFAHTFSIVARDPKTGEMAVAVQSHWFSVGTSVSWGEAGVGVVATQSFTNKSFGMRGLALMKSGKTAQQALDELLSTDEGNDVRQVAILDTKATWPPTPATNAWTMPATSRASEFSVQANMMLNEKVWPAMAKAFEQNAKPALSRAGTGRPERGPSRGRRHSRQAVGGPAGGARAGHRMPLGRPPDGLARR